MATGPRYYTPKAYAFDSVGDTIPGALLNFYLTGSDTRAATFSNQTLTVANANPVEADAAGVFPDIFLDPTLSYKVVFTGPDDGITPPHEYWTADPVQEAWPEVTQSFFDVPFEWLTGATLPSAALIGQYIATKPTRIFPDFDGTSQGYVKAWGACNVAPSVADVPVAVYKNHDFVTVVGSMTIKKDTGQFVFSTTAGLPIDLDAGEYLSFLSPVSVDPSLEQLVWTITAIDLTGETGGGGGSSGSGDVSGPGSSTAGHFAVFADTTGKVIADAGGGPGALAFLNNITASLVTNFMSTVLADVTALLVAGTNVSITPVGSTLVLAASGGSGGGDVSSTTGVALNGELVLFSGTTGKLIGRSNIVPAADMLTFFAAANFAAMRTALSLTSAATTALGTSGGTIPLLNGASTWAAIQTFTLAPVFGDATGTRTNLGLGALAVQNTITASQISDPVNVKPLESLEVAASDETTPLTTGVSVVSFWIPYNFTLTDLFIGNGVASSSGGVTANLKQNGSSVLSTLPTIGSGQNTSITGAGSTAAVISGGAAVLSKGDKMTVDITAAGTAAAGLKAVLIGHRT